jgi:hypothetical protein
LNSPSPAVRNAVAYAIFNARKPGRFSDLLLEIGTSNPAKKVRLHALLFAVRCKQLDSKFREEYVSKFLDDEELHIRQVAAERMNEARSDDKGSPDTENDW